MLLFVPRHVEFPMHFVSRSSLPVILLRIVKEHVLRLVQDVWQSLRQGVASAMKGSLYPQIQTRLNLSRYYHRRTLYKNIIQGTSCSIVMKLENATK